MTRALALAAAAAGAVLWRWLVPWPETDPVLALVAVRSPLASELLRWGYAVCWIATPYSLVLVSVTVAGLLVERRRADAGASELPPWPESVNPGIVIGETHRRTLPGPSAESRLARGAPTGPAHGNRGFRGGGLRQDFLLHVPVRQAGPGLARRHP